MKIWLIMSGEPLEQFGERPHRVGILSKMLVEEGHNVTWWTTDYDHQHKKYLYGKDTEIVNDFGVSMVFLHPKTPYNKNISLSRIRNHKEVADKFKNISYKKEKPDIILCAFPTIDLAYEAVNYGKDNNIPVVVDVRDLWPDIFFDILPNKLKFIGKLLLSGYVNKTKYIFENCTNITGVSNNYLEYGINYGNKVKTELDKVFYLGYKKEELSSDKYEELYSEFLNLGIDKDKILIWFVGTFGQTYDLKPVISIANKFKNKNIQFVFTGDGENMEEWKLLAQGNENIIFTGWVNKDALLYLGKISDIGLMAYRYGAPQGLPNKLFEYCANGLVILSSLQGETKDVLETAKIGFTYSNKNELEKYLNILLKNSDIDLISQKSKELFENTFLAQKVYGNMIEYLENIVKKYKENIHV